MRLLWVTDNYLPHRGGSRVVYHNICRELGNDQVCVVTKWMEGCKAFDSSAGYPIERFRVPFLKIFSALGIEDLYLIFPLLLKTTVNVIRKRPDVIHCGEALASGLVGYIIRKVFGIPYIVWLHDNPFGPVSRFRYPLRRHICLGASGIATACSYARDEVKEAGVKSDRIDLVYPSVDTAIFKPTDGGGRLRARFDIEGKKVLLTISRLLPHKGQDTVIRLLPRLLSMHHDLVYLIGGCGPYRKTLEDLACSLGVTDRVIFAGFIPQEEIADYYNASDLFIMLNREVDGLSLEGFGIVFLEASACGKPVIGGRSGGVSDSILDGTSGFLVDPRDEGEVAEKIDLLLRDLKLAEKMGAAGLKHARNDFSWRESARRTMAFSERLAGAAKRRDS